MKEKILKTVCILMMISPLFSCESKTLKQFNNPYPEGALNAWSGVWKIYDDDLITGGNVAFIPSDLDPPNNHLAISFNVTQENPPEGTRCMRFDWDGKELYWAEQGRVEHDWAGVSLIVATHWSLYDSTPAKDLSAGGYTKITFKAKAFVDNNTTIKFEGPVREDKGGKDYVRLSNTQLADWNTYTINVTPLDLKAVKDYFKVVIDFPTGKNNGPYGNGGTVFVDDVRYVR